MYKFVLDNFLYSQIYKFVRKSCAYNILLYNMIIQ